MDTQDRVEMRMIFRCESTKPEERIILVGSLPELGSWDPSKGVKLLTDATCFPFWSGTIHIPTMSTFEYKYVIVNSINNTVSRWEELPDNGNRILTVKQKGIFSVEEQEGSRHIQIKMIKLTKSISSIFKNRLSQFSRDKPKKKLTKIRSHDFNSDPKHQVKFAETFATSVPRKKTNLEEEKQTAVLEERNEKSENSLEKDRLNLMSKKQKSFYNLQELKLGQNKLIDEMDSSSEEDEHHRKASGVVRNLKDLEMKVLSVQDFTKLENLDSNAVQKNESQAPAVKLDTDYSKGFEDAHSSKHEFELTEKEFVIMVSMILPLKISKDPTGKISLVPSSSLLYSKLYDRDPGSKVEEWWIGWAAYHPKDDKEKEEITNLLREKRCMPIFFEKEVIAEFYNFYERQVIPLFHNFKTHYEHKESYDQFDDWNCYREVNQIFADFIVEFINNEVYPKKKNPIIWVNNQHFIMVPRYLRENNIDTCIGLFLHCPFPASEIFRLIPYRERLLKSLLNCDCIGFHSFEYARNFFTICKRILNVDFEFRRSGQIGIDYNGRNVSLVIAHVGVSYDSIYNHVHSPAFKRLLKTCKRKTKTIISSIDTLTHIAGIKEKFLAFQKLLRMNPALAGECKLIQYLDPISVGKEFKVKEYKDIITKIKDDIKKEFGSKVISVKYEVLTEKKRILLWARTNILFNCTLRGGLRLPSLEYIATRCSLKKESNSLIVLSEFAGGIRALGGVLKCNPHSLKETSNILERAMSMDKKEKHKRMRNMLQYVLKHSTLSWANQFLRDLKCSHETTESSLFLGIESEVVKHRLIHRKNTKPLDHEAFLNAYENTSKRLIMIDTHGIDSMQGKATANDFNFSHPEISDKAIHLLDSLSREVENKVWIIGPDGKNQLDLIIKKSDRYDETSSKKTRENKWDRLLKELDNSWIEEAKRIMKVYCESVDGSFIEEHESTIMWNFSIVDSEYGNSAAKQMKLDLQETLKYFNIEVCIGKGYLEARNKNIKEIVVNKILKGYSRTADIDFILYIGDDNSNEEIFSLLKDQTKMNEYCTKNFTSFLCTIGKRPTKAKYYIEDLEHLLKELFDNQKSIKSESIQ
ncbi:unnamed protein product [Moneuplotes crassus]|uniref:CBM20 domain-containing protein n=1 Tax=Euplotes crassus TaxID=5936 RepID=A0AAD2CVA9_EUPCR|nr:unnamed protein product [Moneuplotes crassus]